MLFNRKMGEASVERKECKGTDFGKHFKPTAQMSHLTLGVKFFDFYCILILQAMLRVTHRSAANNHIIAGGYSRASQYSFTLRPAPMLCRCFAS